jgi:predicted nuclease of predicted toxin-antitoxin system
MKFLIDECLSPLLVDIANECGFEAYHVAHRGWSGLKDGQLLKHLVDEELILVTNNRDDFLALVGEVELHPGLVVILDNLRREQQIELFAAAIDVVRHLPSMINKVAEVSSSGTVSIYDLPHN